MVMRLISSTKTDIMGMDAAGLKESILASEARVIMGQHHVMLNTGLVDGVTNTEIQAAFGADMVMLNGFDLVNEAKNIGLREMKSGNLGEHPYSVRQIKQWAGVPLGIYLECPDANAQVAGERYVEAKAGRVATRDNFLRIRDLGADFVVLGGNPSSGTTFEQIISATRLAKATLGDGVLICAGKWEDGSIEKVLGDPLSQRPANDIIKDLIDAGADVETIRLIALMMKQTGADIHAIGDGGYAGTPMPENVFQLAVSIKGKRHTIKRMVGRCR